MRSSRGVALALALAALAIIGGAGRVVAQPEAEIDLQSVRGDRAVDLRWSVAAESADSLFGGYEVWRSTSPDPRSFALIQRYQRRYPVSWVFAPGTPRKFTDPDSIFSYLKVEVSGSGDSAIVRDYVGIPPFNGFPYFYAVTWLSECLSARNDTITVHQPQPAISCLGGRCFFLAGGDTMFVNRTPCRRIDPRTNRPVGDTTFVYQGRVESEEPLRRYAIAATQLQEPVFPAASTRPNLAAVAAIPNPYISSAPWDRPGERKIQFVNLPQRATVRIFTVGADLVRVLEHPAPGSLPDQGSTDWDLKNAEGNSVESGIYIFQVETPGGVADVQGRLVIVR